MNSRRHVPPGIYNVRRLRELPIPDIGLDSDFDGDTAHDDGTSADNSFDNENQCDSIEEITLPDNLVSNLVDSLVDDHDPLDANEQSGSRFGHAENVVVGMLLVANHWIQEKAMHVNSSKPMLYKMVVSKVLLLKRLWEQMKAMHVDSLKVALC